MPVYLVLVIAVVVAAVRSRDRIQQIEGPQGPTGAPPSRRERWAGATGAEKALFLVLAAAGAVWLLLILPIGFAAAAVALGVTVWKRPYLEATLAPVVLVAGAVIASYDLLLALLQDESDWGAAAINTALFGGPWIVIGLLLRTAANARANSASTPSGRGRV